MAKKQAIGQAWLVAPGDRLSLGGIDPGSLAEAPGDCAETEKVTEELRLRLIDLQERLWAEDRQSLLVVLQALDAGGKDGVVRKVFSGVNPQGCRVRSFKAPTAEELDHDFLWRIHPHAPGRGEIAIFNRSHYEDVLAVRVLGLAPPEVWQARYPIIRDFERGLALAGTRILKVMLHISKDEQAKRLQTRLDDPTRRWKFRRADLDTRAQWDDYIAAFEDALSETSIDQAPWYVVPADRKWYRNWVVLSILVATLEAMDPQFPEPTEDLSGITIDS